MLSLKEILLPFYFSDIGRVSEYSENRLYVERFAGVLSSPA
jgi:hypothetical protein